MVSQSIAPLLYLGSLCVLYFSETFPFKPDRIQCKTFVHVIAERTNFVFVSLSQKPHSNMDAYTQAPVHLLQMAWSKVELGDTWQW